MSLCCAAQRQWQPHSPASLVHSVPLRVSDTSWKESPPQSQCDKHIKLQNTSILFLLGPEEGEREPESSAPLPLCWAVIDFQSLFKK